jgi:hypothetical protein
MTAILKFQPVALARSSCYNECLRRLPEKDRDIREFIYEHEQNQAMLIPIYRRLWMEEFP